MHRGYVKLWRKSIDKGWLKDHQLWVLWCWCLIKASHKEIDILVGLKEVRLNPGEFIFGRKKASKELGMSEQSIRTRLDFLKNAQNLTIKTTNKFSIISIINWQTYQGEEVQFNQQTNQPLTNNQPTTNHKQTQEALKELKEVKTITKKILFLDFVFLTQKEFENLVEQFGEEGANQRIDRLNVYLGSTGKRYKSHYFTILNWERRNGGSAGGPSKPKGGTANVDQIKKQQQEERRIQNGSAGQSQSGFAGK